MGGALINKRDKKGVKEREGLRVIIYYDGTKTLNCVCASTRRSRLGSTVQEGAAKKVAGEVFGKRRKKGVYIIT